jgi:acyl-coenzyme A synthetase/AMP-(fatty) acid ligase
MCHNALDRHLATRPNQTALIYESTMTVRTAYQCVRKRSVLILEVYSPLLRIGSKSGHTLS